MLGKRRGRRLFFGKAFSDHERAKERLHGSLTLGFAALTEKQVQLVAGLPPAGPGWRSGAARP